VCVCCWKHCDEPKDFWVMLLSVGLDSQTQFLHSYFAAYFIGITFLFAVAQNKSTVLRLLYWIYDQCPSLHKWYKMDQWGDSLTNTIRRLKAQPVCVLVNTDEVYIILFASWWKPNLSTRRSTSCFEWSFMCATTKKLHVSRLSTLFPTKKTKVFLLNWKLIDKVCLFSAAFVYPT